MESKSEITDQSKNYYIEMPNDNDILLKNLWLTIFHYQNIDSETWNSLLYDYTKFSVSNTKALNNGVVTEITDSSIIVNHNGSEHNYSLVDETGKLLKSDLIVGQNITKGTPICFNEKEVNILKSRIARSLNEKTITWNTLMRGIIILDFKAIKISLTILRKNGITIDPIVIPVNNPKDVMTSFVTQKLVYNSFEELVDDIEGAISVTYELLCRLFRAAIYRLNITPQFIDKKLSQIALVESKTSDSIAKGRTLSSIKNNTIKILLKDRFTWDGFMKSLQVLGFKKSRLTLTLINNNGEIQNYDMVINV